jgi:hypothetical protein
MGDFRSVIHCPVVTFLGGGNPYDYGQVKEVCPESPNFPLFAPATLVLHAPFGLLPFDSAARAFVIWTLALTVLMAYLAFRVNGVRPTTAGIILVVALVLLSRPGQWNLLLGNLAVEFTLACYLALYYARPLPVISGIGFAVATIKPSFGVPLAILMVARRDYRALALGIAIALLMNLPPSLALAKRAGGLDRFAQTLLYTQARWQTYESSYSANTTFRVDLAGFLTRILGHPLGSSAQAVVALLVLVTAAIAIRSLGQQTDATHRHHLSSDIVCVAIVLCVYHLGYDLVLLTAPVVALALRTLPHGFATERFRSVLLLLMAVLGANYLTSEAILVHLRQHRLVWLLVGSINSVVLLVLFLVYVIRTLMLPLTLPQISTRPRVRDGE